MLDSLKKFTFVRLIDRLIEKGTFSPHFHIQSNTELIEVRQRSTTWNQKLASHPTIQIRKSVNLLYPILDTTPKSQRQKLIFPSSKGQKNVCDQIVRALAESSAAF